MSLTKIARRVLLLCDNEGMPHMKNAVENEVIEFAKALNDSKEGNVNSVVVTKINYHTDGRTGVALKTSEIKFEVKCKNRWGWNEVIAMMPYITIIAIAITVMVLLSCRSRVSHTCNISTTYKAIVDKQ